LSIYEALRNIKITEEDLEDCYKNLLNKTLKQMKILDYFEKAPKLDQYREILNQTFDEDIITFIYMHMKFNSPRELKDKIVDEYFEFEEENLEENEEELDDEDKKKTWYQQSLKVLGEEKYKKHLSKLLSTPLIGNWRKVYISLQPFYSDSKKKYVLVEFKNSPSIATILYTHLKIWQSIKGNYDGKPDNHHYSSVEIKGDNENLIIHFGISS
jgi:hypothetical protein